MPLALPILMHRSKINFSMPRLLNSASRLRGASRRAVRFSSAIDGMDTVVVRYLPQYLVLDFAQPLDVDGQCGGHADCVQVIELGHLMCREPGMQIVGKFGNFTRHWELADMFGVAWQA